jgi:hypothetical protein
MKHDQVLRIKSMTEKKKRKAILSAAKHNHRELPPEAHIDPKRSHLNRVLYGAGTAAEVAQRAKGMMDAAGIKPRAVNTILAVEVLICLPANFDGDAMAFFNDALAWADEFYQVPVLSAIAHFDESAPHMHIVLLPIIDGKLNGRAVMGDLPRIQAMHSDFYASVGRKHGLSKKTAHRRSKEEQHTAAMQILNAIRAKPALLDGGQVKSLLLEAIGKNLDAFAASVGVVLPEPKAKPSKETFVGIMTKPQRPERNKTPIAVHPMPIAVHGPAVVSDIGGKPANCYALIALQDLQPIEAPVIDAPTILSIEPATMHDTDADSDQAITANAEMPAPQIDCEPDVSQDAAHTTTVTPSDALPDAGLVQIDDGDFERVRDEELDPGEWDADRGEFIRQTSRPSRKAQAEHVVQVALAAVSKQPSGRGRWRIASI